MTTAKECADLARATLDALNDHDLDRFAATHADNSETETVPTGERSFGPSGARDDMERWFRAFPDMQLELLELSAGEDSATLELMVRGRHDGPLAMPDGELPATGRKTENRVCVVMRIENGKIVRERDYFDVATMMRQLTSGAEQPVAAKAEQRPHA